MPYSTTSSTRAPSRSAEVPCRRPSLPCGGRSSRAADAAGPSHAALVPRPGRTHERVTLGLTHAESLNALTGSLLSLRSRPWQSRSSPGGARPTCSSPLPSVTGDAPLAPLPSRNQRPRGRQPRHAQYAYRSASHHSPPSAARSPTLSPTPRPERACVLGTRHVRPWYGPGARLARRVGRRGVLEEFVIDKPPSTKH
jgi:hypothetical protein